MTGPSISRPSWRPASRRRIKKTSPATKREAAKLRQFRKTIVEVKAQASPAPCAVGVLRRDQVVMRAARRRLRRPARRRTSALLPAPIPSQSAAAGSAAARRRSRSVSQCVSTRSTIRRRSRAAPPACRQIRSRGTTSSATRNAAKVDSGRPARFSSACRLAPPRSCSSEATRASGRPDNSASA